MLPPRLITLLLILTVCGPVVAAPLTAQRLDAGPGTVRAVRARDLTGDGVPDLTTFVDGPDGPVVRIWCARNDGTFGETPDLVFEPGKHGLEAVDYAFLAALESDQPATLLLVDRKAGVVSFTVVFAEEKWVVHGPDRIADAPALPFPPDARRWMTLDAAADVDGDGDDELLLPAADGYRIVDRTVGEDGKSFVSSRALPTGASRALSDGPHRFMDLHWRLPRLLVADSDGDGIPDLMASRGRELLLFLQRPDGSFQVERPRVDRLAPDSTSAEKNTFVLGDVNGDGREDLVLTATESKIRVMDSFHSRHLLFLHPHIVEPRTPGKLSTPVSLIRTSGRSLPPMLFDFEGDGDLDLLVSSLEIDLGSLIRKDVSAEYSLYRFDGKKGKFEESSLFDVTRPYPWDRIERGETPQVCFFSGDFDGDGSRDLLDLADDGHLTILAGGHDDSLFAADYDFAERDGRPLIRVKAALESDVLIRDLDGDGATDLVGRGGNHVYVIRGRP